MPRPKTKSVDDDAKLLGYRILMLRTHLRMSQRDFAQKLGCTQYMISSWESGKALISTKHIMEIVRKFDISIAYFDPVDSQQYAAYLAKS